MKTTKQKTAGTKVSVGEFDEAALLESVTGFAKQLQSGKVHTLRSTTINLPKPLPVRSAAEVRAVREKLGASQALFAALLNLPARTVSSWENSQRKPSGAALKLLNIAERYPEVFSGHLSGAAKTDTRISKASVSEKQVEKLVDDVVALLMGKPLPSGVRIVNGTGEMLTEVRRSPDGGHQLIFSPHAIVKGVKRKLPSGARREKEMSGSVR